MVMYTNKRADDHSDVSVIACRALVWTSVGVSVLGFWSKGYLPAAILTVVMGSVVTLLSFTLGRLVLAFRVKEWRLFGQMLGLGCVFVLIEATLNHIGLQWLNDTYKLAPAEQVGIAMWFLPLLNVFATDSYTREIKDPEVPSLGKQLADLRWKKVA